MNQEIKEKSLKNSLIIEKLLKYDPDERQEATLELLKTTTAKELSKEIGVSETTIHDWKTKRNIFRSSADNIGLTTIYKRLLKLNANNIKDWGRFEMIKEEIDRITREHDKK